MKSFLESQKETSKLSGNVFWVAGTIWSLRNPKNVIFLYQNDVNSRKPSPLLTYLRDIRLLDCGECKQEVL